MGKKIGAVVIALFMGAAAFCSSVSFQIVQHADGLSELCLPTLVMEDEILNSFYGAGYIVSNIPAVISHSESQDNTLWSQGYKEAAEGFFDSFIQIHLYLHSSGVSNKSEASLGDIEKVSWKIVSISTGKMIDEGSRKVSPPKGKDGEENVRGFADGLASYLQKAVKK